MLRYVPAMCSLWLMAGCAAPIANFSIPPAVQDQAISLEATASAEPLAKGEATLQVRNAGNFGIIWRYSQTHTFSRTANGLTEDLIASTPLGGGGVPFTRRIVSLCGAIPLLVEQRSGGDGPIVAVPTPPSGAVVVSGVNLPAEERILIQSLEVSAKSFCAPNVGDSFLIKLDGLKELAAHGPIGTIRTVHSFDDTVTCSTLPLESDQSLLAQAGATLLLRCSHVPARAFRPLETHFVYFPKAGRYLEIYVHYSPATNDRIEFKNVQIQRE